jgi:hypothetical protein
MEGVATMDTKIDATTEARTKLARQIREQQSTARKLRLEHPNALSDLDEFIQQIFDPAVVFSAASVEGYDETEDDEIYGG